MSRIALDAIVSGGQNNFLSPPEHPTHRFHVETDRNRRKENRSSYSLDYAVYCESIGSPVRKQVARMLEAWGASRPSLDAPEVRDWVSRVLGYFRDCYIPENGDRSASEMLVDRERDPLAHSDSHAGVAFVRDFYPEFNPTSADFAAAYWGRKPQ